jgi:hypothetical protein
MSKAKLGSALYNFRKEKGLLNESERNHKISSLSERKSAINRNPNSWQSRFKIPQDWTHDVHGSVFGASVSDLIRLFPQQKLNESGLSRVKNGKQSAHKGWRSSSSNPAEKSVIIMGSVPVSTETKTKSDYCMDLINRGS